MEEIKVGEYGRTNLGKIIKFAWFEEEKGVTCKNKVILVDEMIKSSRPFYYFEKNEFIKNHSKNIIDLIEIGDYVNGEKVENIEGFDKNGNDIIELGVIENDLDYAYGVFLTDLNIRSIVTKEQFASAEYRLED